MLSSLLAGIVILFISFRTTIDKQYEAQATETETTEKNTSSNISTYEEQPTPNPKREVNFTEVGEVQSYIKEVFTEEDAYSWAYYVARCESNFNPNAVSSTGKYKGVFQYSDETFRSNCTGNIFDYKAQIDCTYKLYLRGELTRWPVCNSKYQNLT